MNWVAFLHVFIQVVFVLILLGGLAIVPLGFPGTWVVVAGSILYALVADFDTQDWKVILITVIFAISGEIAEYLSTVLGAKRENVPTNVLIASMIGGLVGGIIGVPIFLIGSLLGLLLGTYLGALLFSLFKVREVPVALSMATSALFSRAIALFAKTAITLAAVVYLLFKVF